jgi:predicted amidohydrolase
MICGKELFVFTETPIGNFSVFICFDYLSPQDLIKFRGVIDTLFVITLNPDVRAYNECAKADAYRSLYGFIIIVNAFDPYSATRLKGKSGFYGPLRENRSIAEFEEKKYGMMIEDLPLNELIRAKRGEESSTMKSLPADFEVIDLSRDYPERASI